MRQAVLLFDETRLATLSPQIRGGKGLNLANMEALGLPVPPGFTIPTSVCRAYLEHGRMPSRFGWHLKRGMAELESKDGRSFGQPGDSSPLLVSVRSGAATSMPGMMDTILNVGFAPGTSEAMAEAFGSRLATELQARLARQFGNVFGLGNEHFDGIDAVWTGSDRLAQYDQLMLEEFGQPLLEQPWEQLELAIAGVFDSWNSERARAYRASQELPDWEGTAVNVQAMVYGNMDDNSCTGVVFSHDVATGTSGLNGEYLVCAQGEDLVSGVCTPQSITEMAKWNPAVYAELEHYVALLSDVLDGIVDVEFTVQSGKLYILQARKATRTPLAAATHAVHQVWEKRWSREQAVASLSSKEVSQLGVSTISEAWQAMFRDSVVAHGLSACPGVASGWVAWTSDEAIEFAKEGKPVVLVTRETSPEDLPGMLASQAIVTAIGGATCHAAVVARGMGIPAVVGVGEAGCSILESSRCSVTVDGAQGVVATGVYPLSQGELPKEANILLRWLAASAPPRIGWEWTSRNTSVEQLLVDFYLSDAMAAEAVGSDLEERARSLRNEIHRDTAELFAAYLFIAISGEVRYLWRGHRLVEATAETQRLAEKLGPIVQGEMREQAQLTVTETLQQQTLQQQLEYVEAVERVFEDPMWRGSVGGMLWAAIARALRCFLSGEYSHTVFVDHTFDLRHNGGRLFDKHSMVDEGRYRLMVLLERKKEASGAHQLQELLRGYPTSDKVAELWREGMRLQLWRQNSTQGES